MRDMDLESSGLNPVDEKAIFKHVCKTIDAMIAEAKLEWQELNPESTIIPLPLIRLRVDYGQRY